MKTPKKYSENLKQRIITDDMLADCIYSANKYAKNHRDQERKYREKYRSNRYIYDRFHDEEKSREKKEKYYSMKDKMLSLIDPICIHKTTYNKSYYIGGYDDYDDDEYDFDDENEGECVEEQVDNYFLFYRIANHSFHTPIDDSFNISKNYPDLEIIDIGELNTYGCERNNLLSPQFVKKVVSLIESGNYVYSRG